ncbi:H/ACA ribonucleoprotein complex non-core subunit NAF1-like [Corticium candelabrum]|uniref:H/ACA ribonucleoprotein complex non-core subunit NAF1-like n=1 Tax=Corticium candelabrum TaxID=121492 RepID=UPI002E26C793|nr:H/ACA ribonucleoprotein complex non-core subunit NAF1-like [Corticium candelabrum]
MTSRKRHVRRHQTSRTIVGVYLLMEGREDDDLVEKTVRLVLDGVCAKVGRENSDLDGSRRIAGICDVKGRLMRKLVDYGTTEAEESGEDTGKDGAESSGTNFVLNNTRAPDVVYVGKHVDGTLFDDDGGKVKSQGSRVPTTDNVTQSNVPDDKSDSSSDSDSSDFGSFSGEEKREVSVESESSSDAKSESADEESEANSDEPVYKFEKKVVVKIESDDSDTGATHNEPPKVEGELQLRDLPTVSPLDFVLSTHDELDKIGSVHSIVDTLVVVQSRPMLPALDTDSVLWKSDRRPLGSIFETFGPVQSPYYSIRFQSRDQIQQCGVSMGMSIFYAPNNKQYTKYVFASQLMQLKGSDASWEDDIEPPLEAVDFSDDETEKRANQRVRQQRQPHTSVNQHGDGRKRPRNLRKGQRNRRQNIEPTQFHGSSSSHPAVHPRPHHHQQPPHLSSVAPRMPSPRPRLPYPQHSQSMMPPRPLQTTSLLQATPPVIPGFVKQGVKQESTLPSVFYRPPPPGHVESYQQCYIMSTQLTQQGTQDGQQSQ